MSRKVLSLSPHNQNWSEAFSVASDILREKNSAGIELHHIGSASIPNIRAKPVLDILGVVPSIDAFDGHQSEFEALGFVWKGEYGIAKRRYCVLYDHSGEFSLIHLHVFAESDREVEKHLVFRDFLRDSSDASRRYEGLKKKLSETHADAHKIFRRQGRVDNSALKRSI